MEFLRSAAFMRDETHTPNERPANSTRRGFLRGVGTVTLATTVSAGTVAATVGDPPIHSLQGTLEDPITVDEIRAVRRQAVAAHRATDGELRGPHVETVPGEGHNPIVDFRYMVDANGRTWQFSASANTPRALADARSDARVHEKQFEQAYRHSKETDVTTSATYWDSVHTDTHTNCDDPHGCVTNDFRMYRLRNDGDSGDDAWAIRHNHSGTPGSVKYGSSWSNYDGTSKHDWSAGDIGGADYLEDWDPASDKDGPQSVDVSVDADGTTESWDFWLKDGIGIDDQSRPTDALTKWNLSYYPRAQDERTSVSPGSSIWLTERDSGKYHVLDLLSMQTYYVSSRYHFDSDDVGWLWHIYFNF